MPPPVTPDIGRSRSATGGCFSVPGPASIGLGMFDKHGFISLIGESAPGTGEPSSSTPTQYSDYSGKIEPPGAPAPAASNATTSNATTSDCAATPVPTPDKEEAAHWRPRKKSTKGVPRFKVMKDKLLPTPVKARKTPVAKQPGGGESAGGDASDIAADVHKKPAAKRKLDLDAQEVITGMFGRARLTENLRRLAETSGGGMMRKKRKGKTGGGYGEQAIVLYNNQGAPGNGASCSALVPAGISTQLAVVPQKKVRTKVLGLDDETLKVYGALVKWDEIDTESFEGVDIGSGPDWDAKRHKYKLLVDWFIDVVKGIFGSREFSRWGGSVIDSVVGTFLTQNVADNLSSNAFMTLAAKFPMNDTKDNAEECSYEPPLTVDVLNRNEASSDANDSINSFSSRTGQTEEVGCTDKVKGNYGQEYKTIMENFLATIQEKDISTWEKDDLLNLVKDKSGKPICSEKTLRKFIATLRVEDTAHWDKLRKEAIEKGYNNKSEKVSDKVDWEAVRRAPLVDVAKCIACRGQHYLLALRIQAFLTRIKKDHESFDLDWLRHVPRESAKKYLLSVNGLGAKSVDCIRLLSLGHKAFPVDVNVARIVTRLQWVELQCCSEEFHSVDLYPLMEDVQSYLWPRLCTIDKEKLYELHCLMITFGKVICTKVDPNCDACPFRPGCRWYKSKRTRPALPLPLEEHVHEHGEGQASVIPSERLLLSNGSCTPSQQHGEGQASVIPSERLLLSNGSCTPSQQHGEGQASVIPSERLLLSNGSCTPSQQGCQLEIDESRTAGRQPTRSGEPIIEVPPSPEYEYEAFDEHGYPNGDDLVDIEDIMPEGVQYDIEINLCSNRPMVSNGSWTPNCGKGLVLSDSRYTSRKLKSIGHLRTEHLAYVLPDDHVILEEFEPRVSEDPCPYLLIVISCPSDQMVKGTILIPSRTASKGNFPLNGTYFQNHEVFADNASSRFPMTIPRQCIWDLETCMVYFGSSVHSIMKAQPIQDIENCYKRGYICVRGFDRRTGYPRPLRATLHSTTASEKRDGGEQRGGAAREER